LRSRLHQLLLSMDAPIAAGGNFCYQHDIKNSQREADMSGMLLVRDVPPDLMSWIKAETERRKLTQKELILSLLNDAFVNAKGTPQLPLFDKPAKPVLRGVPSVPFKFIDLFAGIGGLRLGLEAAGGKCCFSSEWDKYSQKTYAAWYDEIPHGDINKIELSDIPDHDLLAAGFPCQPFSIAGVSKKNALGRPHGFKDATQGTLFFRLATIIEAKRPPMLLLENVKNLRSHDKGRTWQVIKSTLEELGYVVFSKVIDASGWVPQHRERFFIVGFKREVFGTQIPFEFPAAPEGAKPKMADILESKVDPKYTLTDHLWCYLKNYAAKHKAAGNGFGFGTITPEGISRTLSARYYKDGSEILIPQKGKNPRRLTPREAARLMGFPDDKKIVVSDTQAYKQFGNAVVPKVAQAVAIEMARVLVWHLEKQNDGCAIPPADRRRIKAA